MVTGSSHKWQVTQVASHKFMVILSSIDKWLVQSLAVEDALSQVLKLIVEGNLDGPDVQVVAQHHSTVHVMKQPLIKVWHEGWHGDKRKRYTVGYTLTLTHCWCDKSYRKWKLRPPKQTQTWFSLTASLRTPSLLRSEWLRRHLGCAPTSYRQHRLTDTRPLIGHWAVNQWLFLKFRLRFLSQMINCEPMVNLIYDSWLMTLWFTYDIFCQLWKSHHGVMALSLVFPSKTSGVKLYVDGKKVAEYSVFHARNLCGKHSFDSENLCGKHCFEREKSCGKHACERETVCGHHCFEREKLCGKLAFSHTNLTYQFLTFHS